MKYWLYSEGDILGPYSENELLSVPAFGPGSLVCLEGAAGDREGDWRTAESVPEMAASLSAGVGIKKSMPEKSVTESSSGWSQEIQDVALRGEDSIGEFIDETGLPDVPGAEFTAFPDIKGVQTGFDETIIGEFDARLSRLEGDLEIARLEKDSFSKRRRLKDISEEKELDYVQELENRLKDTEKKVETQHEEFELLKHMYESCMKPVKATEATKATEETTATKATEETTETEELPKVEAKALPKTTEETEAKSVPKEMPRPKQLRGLGPLKPPTIFEMEETSAQPAEAAVSPASADLSGTGGPGPLQGPLRAQEVEQPSAPASQPAQPAAAPKSEPAAVPEIKPAEPPKPAPSTIAYGSGTLSQASVSMPVMPVLPPLSQPAIPEIIRKPQSFAEGGGQPAIEKQQEAAVPPKVGQPAIEKQQESAVPQEARNFPDDFGRQMQLPELESKTPARLDSPMAQKAVRHPEISGRGSPAEGGAVPSPKAEGSARGGGMRETADAVPELTPFPPPAMPHRKEEPPVPDLPGVTSGKTGKIMPVIQDTVPGVSTEPLRPEGAKPKKKKRSRVKFIFIVVILLALAGGGITFFFLDDELSLSEFSLLNLSTGKKAGPADDSASQGSSAGMKRAVAVPPQDQTAAGVGPGGYVTEGVGKALDIVKNYSLGGGRGTMSSWFQNSFLSSPGSGVQEEWSATVLHGDVYVVQFRLLRPRAEPLVYQFEVDVSKKALTRGVNNAAIDLLGASPQGAPPPGTQRLQAGFSQSRVDGAGLRDAGKKKKSLKSSAVRRKKTRKSKEVPLLPLPDAPSGDSANNYFDVPTGFENGESALP